MIPFFCYNVKAINVGDKLGDVLNTDIKVYINNIQIAGYNINGWTYIVAEDLCPYGFNVIWNGRARSLSITMGAEIGSIKKISNDTSQVGTAQFSYVYTDIIVNINGKTVKSYNIQGYTVIRIDDLANEFGNIVWDSTKKEIHVSIIPIDSIILDVHSTTINRWDSQKINHTVYPVNATESVRYTSSNEQIATVSNDGKIYAISVGKVTIKCISTSGKVSALCVVNVVIPVTHVTVSVKRNNYLIGESCPFEVKIYPDNATDKTLTVSVSNSNASVSGGNAVSCVSHGKVTITVTASNGVSGYKEISVIDLVKYADEVFRLTNIERYNNGLPEFLQNNTLRTVAVLRAQEIVGKYSHTRPDENEWFTAFSKYGITYQSAAENLCRWQNTPAEVVEAWMNSPKHRENILNPKLTNLGIGVVMDSNGKLYWSQEFTN